MVIVLSQLLNYGLHAIIISDTSCNQQTINDLLVDFQTLLQIFNVMLQLLIIFL
jgi:hypothetical protein